MLNLWMLLTFLFSGNVVTAEVKVLNFCQASLGFLHSCNHKPAWWEWRAVTMEELSPPVGSSEVRRSAFKSHSLMVRESPPTTMVLVSCSQLMSSPTPGNICGNEVDHQVGFLIPTLSILNHHYHQQHHHHHHNNLVSCNISSSNIFYTLLNYIFHWTKQ